MPFEKAHAAILSGYGAWLGPICNGESPGFGLVDLGAVPCGAVEYNGNLGNVNVVVFRDEAWPHEGSYIALTTVQFDKDSGEIWGADMEINSDQYNFTTTDTQADVDLVSIITHEAGHVYGIGHTEDSHCAGPGRTSTMCPMYEQGAPLAARTLEPDDMRAMCALFPPKSIDPAVCNPIPRHGFEENCANDQPFHGCALSPSPPQRLLDPRWLPLALGATLSLRRARRARAPGRRSA